MNCCGQVAVRLRLRLRFERNVTLLTYKPLRLLCGLKIIQNTLLAVRLRFEPQQSVHAIKALLVLLIYCCTGTWLTCKLLTRNPSLSSVKSKHFPIDYNQFLLSCRASDGQRSSHVCYNRLSQTLHNRLSKAHYHILEGGV